MSRPASELARRLARDAEAVCRHYLSTGRRRAVLAGGRCPKHAGPSLFVRLSGRKAARAQPESGRYGSGQMAICFTSSARPGPPIFGRWPKKPVAFYPSAADRIARFGEHAPTTLPHGPALRHVAPIARTVDVFAPSRNYGVARNRKSALPPTLLLSARQSFTLQIWPAMIAAVTDLDGKLTGAHRTWLDSRHDKAPIETPRRAMGNLFGHGVDFGIASEVMAAGEGIETVLSLRCVMPAMPMMAALSSAHLAAIRFLPSLRRLYILRDNDAAGDDATAILVERATAAGVEAIVLSRFLTTSTTIFGSSVSTSCERRSGSDCAGRRRPLHEISGVKPIRETASRTHVALSRRIGALSKSFGEDRGPGLHRGRPCGKRSGRNGCGRLFSVAPVGRFTARTKSPAFRHPPLRFGPSLRFGCKPGPPAAFRRHEGREGRGRSDEGKRK